ncbi:hypothetical protein LMG33810_000773 [Carnimonas sp. LMG 33810]
MNAHSGDGVRGIGLLYSRSLAARSSGRLTAALLIRCCRCVSLWLLNANRHRAQRLLFNRLAGGVR